MSATNLASLLPSSPPSVRAARITLVALHVPYVVGPVIYVATSFTGTMEFRLAGLGALLAAVPAGLLQVRHSLAVAAGYRPRGWPLTYAALAVLTITPAFWFGTDWESSQLLLAAATFMLFSWRAGALVLVGAVAYALSNAPLDQLPPAAAVHLVVYFVATSVVYSVALPGAVLLVRVLTEAGRARADLADRAVEVERTRIARDLHDLVGQSLVAVSLKGNLALQLLPVRPDAARAEVAGLTEVARTALHGVRSLTRHRPALELQPEIDGAVTLLAAAGIRTVVEADLHHVSDLVKELLAWAVREGTTNVLRHSDATLVTITISHHEDGVRFELRNDAPRAVRQTGTGLDGLRHRAAVMHGEAAASHDGRDWVLRVDVPGGQP